VARTPKEAASSAERDAKVTVTPVEAPAKGRPTPTRKEQEAARKQPLVPSDRRLAARQSRDQQAVQRERARIGMARGEEKYLPARDRGPQKRFARDFVDARFSIGEATVPVLVVAVIGTFVPVVGNYVIIGIYALLLLVVADGIWLGHRIVTQLAAKYGKEKVERGVRWYSFMRAIQLRPMRLPKPQVKRGQYPS